MGARTGAAEAAGPHRQVCSCAKKTGLHVHRRGRRYARVAVTPRKRSTWVCICFIVQRPQTLFSLPRSCAPQAVSWGQWSQGETTHLPGRFLLPCVEPRIHICSGPMRVSTVPVPIMRRRDSAANKGAVGEAAGQVPARELAGAPGAGLCGRAGHAQGVCGAVAPGAPRSIALTCCPSLTNLPASLAHIVPSLHRRLSQAVVLVICFWEWACEKRFNKGSQKRRSLHSRPRAWSRRVFPSLCIIPCSMSLEDGLLSVMTRFTCAGWTG